MIDRPIVFIGSSNATAHTIANALTHKLDIQDKVAECTLWKNIFASGTAILEALELALNRFDFAIIVLSPDDKMVTETGNVVIARDNLLIELGMFIGKLGRSRTFIFADDAFFGKDGHLPSDLAGITLVTYRLNNNDINNSVGNAAIPISQAIQSKSFYQKRVEKSFRGISIEEAINSVGLQDIENRKDRGLTVLPPDDFYMLAKTEVAISGVSTYRTFDQGRAVIEDLLKRGVHVKVLILSPQSQEVDKLYKLEQHGIRADINNVIEKVKSLSVTYPNIQLRFMETLPPFTSVMIDGDLDPSGGKPSDTNGHIRVQPRTAYHTQHEGIILQFGNTERRHSDGFDYFAEDLREQWKSGTPL